MKQKYRKKTLYSRRTQSSRGTRKQGLSKAVVPPGPCQCNPSVGEIRPEHGCIPIEVLQQVAQTLKVSTNQSAPSLRKSIETALSVPENKEHTFVNALPVSEQEKKDIVRMYLRPPAPKSWEKDPDEWLDSNNIADVLNQLEDVYPSFQFMGPFPIDFAAPDPYVSKGGTIGAGAGAGTDKKCLVTEICELRVKHAMENGVSEIGIVYNLDPHFKGGSHWVSNYIDIPGHVCYYFDSYGMEPPAQVKRFMQWLTTQDPEMKLHYSSRRLQYSNTECGIYSIYFISAMLLRKNVSSKEQFLRISRKKASDADMLALRKCFFST
jgi:hypothetical protein